MGISKGIDIYGYVSNPSYTITAETRGNDDLTFSQADDPLIGSMQHGHREIDSGNIDWDERTGRFTLQAKVNGSKALTRYAEIAPSTGNLGDTDMGNMLDTNSVIAPGRYAVSYGFYDAGHNQSHQAYLYLTEDHSHWMGNLAAAKPAVLEAPFGKFVLPGAHDAGMFTGLGNAGEARDLIHRLIVHYGDSEKAAAAIITALGLGAASFPVLGPTLTTALVAALVLLETTDTPLRALVNLGYTQKEPISTQLALGTRYFDFRPGYNASFYRKDDLLRHQHAFIPGCRFDDFLRRVVEFLGSHSQEIVVVNIKYDGFLENGMKPAGSEITRYLGTALAGKGIALGDRTDLQTSYQELLDSRKRLIVLEGNDHCRDSYSDSGYATNDPASVIACLDQTLAQPEQDWTVLQLQATYTATTEGIAKAIATFSDAASPLLSTKARFDHATYPWVADRRHVADRCGGRLLVLLNDFVDNALTSHCLAITRQRHGE
ncbi:hypothetical protein [Pseudogulbenkiania sp. MAI-1]|uniref:hypothetical protein n=1 Tax=Pseudogulbenkiania sp. MAI-1 TaxID=990370 RepID=UPI00045E7D26|nr:hypothetical protein [Pseudogulbenkiania sp. MAI-1]